MLQVTSAFAAVLVLTAATAASAQSDRCTKDVLRIEGAPVTATVCAPAGATGPKLAVTETLIGRAGTVSHTTSFDLLAAGVSRTVDDIALDKLGSKRILHVTLAYREGIVTLEHALLLPGAIPVK